MKNWKIIGAITLLVLAVATWRILSYERQRNAPGDPVAMQQLLNRNLGRASSGHGRRICSARHAGYIGDVRFCSRI